MNDKIKNFIHSHYISIPIFIVFCIIACIWFYADRASNIDTTGIRNAQNELRHVREYNQQSIEYNQRVRDAVENSQTLNERTEELTEARNLLQKQEQMLNEQKLSLAKAEIYLEQQKNEIKKAKIQQRNSKLLNILLGGAVIYLVAKD